MVSRRQIRVLFVVGLLLGAAAPGLAAVLNGVLFESGTTVRAADGPAVTIGSSVEVDGRDMFADNETVDLETSAGNLTVSSPSRTGVRVDSITGKWTNTSSINASAGDLTINPEEKSEVVVSGAVTAIDFKNESQTAVGDGQVDFVYSADGSGSVTLKNLAPNTTFTAGATDGSPLGKYTTDANGEVTISVDSASGAGVYLYEGSAPTLSEFNPPDGDDISEKNPTLSVQVNDSDFSRPGGDNVTVKI